MSAKPFSIAVKTLSGESFKMEVTMHDSIRSIKGKIEQQHGYLSKGSKLIFGGKILEDDLTILDCNISKNCVILFIMPGSLSAKSKEEEEFHQKLLSITSMKKQLHAAYFTPTDETFMDILDVKDDKDTKCLQKWCQDNEYDSDALFYDLNDSYFECSSNVYQFMKNTTKNPKKVYSLRGYITQHYQENEDMAEVDDDEKSEYQYKRKYDKTSINDTKGWDNNLNEGIASTFERDEKQMFEDMFKSFKTKMKEKLQQHLKFKRDINALLAHKDDKMTYLEKKDKIQNYLKQMMGKRRQEITSRHKTRVSQMRKQREALDACWRRSRSLPNVPQPTKKYTGGIFGMLYDTINKTSDYSTIANQKEIDRKTRERQKKQSEIDTEMGHREQCANIELQRLEIGYCKETQKIDRMEDLQVRALNDCNDSNDIQTWRQQFEDIDLKEEKNNALVGMIENKIRSTHSKIIFGKYLQNSPFANDIQDEAKVSDHEITKIAKLAGSTLLIDMVNRDIANQVDGNEDEKKDARTVDDELLQFELRLDDDWSNWNETRKLQLQNELAQKLGVDVSALEFVSARDGCIIANFTQKMQNVRGDIGVDFNVAHIGPKAIHDEIYAYNKEWEDKVNGCLDYIQSKIANPAEINEEALYVSQKCVAIIVSHYSQNHTQNVLDGDFLTSDLDKGLYKEIMNPKWDREYGTQKGQGKTYWSGKLNDNRPRGGDKYPYYCPSGWKRYAVRIDGDFDQKYGNWPICYHGSETCTIGSILSHGIYGNWRGTEHLRFFSPSIVYSAHPRYALPKMMNDGQQYVQMVFQCRVDPNAISKCGETLRINRSTQIDPNYPINFQKCQCRRQYANPQWGRSCPVDGHNEIEWFLDITDADKYVIYGIMLRFSNDPSLLPESRWWRGNWKTKWKGK